MGIIDPEEILSIFQDLDALTSTVSIERYDQPDWKPVAGWVAIPAMITTDPDKDDVDYVAFVPAALVPPGIVAVNQGMRVLIDNPRMATGPYAMRKIDDVGGGGLVWQIDLYRQKRG